MNSYRFFIIVTIEVSSEKGLAVLEKTCEIS